MCRSSGTGGTPPGASDVWQTQGLEAPVFGSVAIFGLRGEFSDVWQMNELGDRECEDGAWLTRDRIAWENQLVKCYAGNGRN